LLEVYTLIVSKLISVIPGDCDTNLAYEFDQTISMDDGVVHNGVTCCADIA